MKKQKGFVKGPKVSYFKHGLGVVNAKKSRVKFGVSVSMSLALLATGGFYGIQYRASHVALRQDKPVVASQASTESDPKQKVAPKRAQEDEALAKKIDRKLAEMPKGTTWSVSVRDLNSERMANVNADKTHEAASFYKLFLLAPLENKLDASKWSNHLNRQNIKTCVEMMIKVSDNDCGVAIGNYVGWQNVDTTSASLGLKKTKINNAVQQNTTSREVSELMYRLQNSQLLSDKARRIVFDGLYEQKFRDGIPKGCGPNCLVGNKTGDNGKVRHDAAVVTHGSAKYVVVIMSTGGTWQQVADVEHLIDEAMLP